MRDLTTSTEIFIREMITEFLICCQMWYSLRPGSLAGNRMKKIGQRREPNGLPARLASFADYLFIYLFIYYFFFFALFPTKEPGPRLNVVLLH